MANKLLLIGIDKYQNYTHINNCVKDVVDFRNILIEKYDFEEENIIELYNEKATNFNIQQKFKDYCSILKNDDNLIVYFSGHGEYTSDDERGFWVPYDGNKKYTTWIPNETIITFLERIICKHIFIISDTCFSNSLLLQDTPKSNAQYTFRPSRWALTSAFHKSYTSTDSNSNSLFCESIIEFLNESNSEFRVSELIEYVKNYFSCNPIQKPQGCPLKIQGHKGGELVFTVKNEPDNRILKGYNKFINVLNLYKKNADIEEIVNYEEKNLKIGYQLYKETDSIAASINYYLYLYSGINQSKTLDHIKRNYSFIFDSTLIIILPKELNQKDVEKRKNNIKTKFNPTNILYIDDFIRKTCTTNTHYSGDIEPFLQISNFILPSYYNNSNVDIKSFIEKWQYSLSEPILVIKGTGGIGKTTFAQYIVDCLISKSPFTSVLFIDSSKIKDNLISRNINIEQLGIYSFYESLFYQDNSIGEKLSEELFKINLDAGNILLVIDGLDEIISKIPNFNVDIFLKSISETSNELGGGKVLITCRTHFWNQQPEEHNLFQVIELKPFDKAQTREFFTKSLISKSKITKAIKLSDEFKFTDNNNENVYHPYVLDIIRSIIELSDDEIKFDLTEFSSSILNPKIKNDYIIYRVCDRERKRIGQISIDEQILFFIYLAVERRSSIYLTNFKSEIEDSLDKKIDSINTEAFKSHPFLQNNLNAITFKYDFFSDVFKGIYLANFINSKTTSNSYSNGFLETISECCWFDSNLNNEIIKRIHEWSDIELLFISEIVENIQSDESIDIDKKKKIIANIFNISLLTNHKFNSNDIESNTALLKVIFEKPTNQINNLSIINIITDKKIKFNFSNLQIFNAYITGYNSFYDCSFNDKTKFISSRISNIESNKSTEKLSGSMFIDCIYDTNISDSINNFNTKQKTNIDKAKFFINLFFHLFYSNGKLGRQWEEKVIKPRFNGVDKYNYGYKNVMKILKNRDVIQSADEKEGIKLFINERYKSDVIRYVKDGTISPIISNLIKDFISLNCVITNP